MTAVLAVSGNPRPGSRTHRVGLALAAALAGRDPVAELEVITIADQLFSAPDQRSAEAKEAVTTLQTADLAIIATPVYKASYTGLLKSFLDLYNAGVRRNRGAVGRAGRPGCRLDGQAPGRDRPAAWASLRGGWKAGRPEPTSR